MKGFIQRIFFLRLALFKERGYLKKGFIWFYLKKGFIERKAFVYIVCIVRIAALSALSA